MNPYEYILNLRDNASGPIQAIAQSIGITNNNVTVLNNTLNQVNFYAQETERTLEKTFGQKFRDVLGGAATKIKDVAGSVLEIGGVDDFVSKVVEARTEYEKLNGIKGGIGDHIEMVKNNWNEFLVAVGGAASGMISGGLEFLNQGILFLIQYLPYVTEWFSILWSMVQPVITALSTMIQTIFSFTDAGSALSAFGAVMTGVLIGIDWLTTGLATVIGWLTPFADVILLVVGAYYLWNNALVIFNMLMAVNPVTWIIIGIMALIMVIGMVMKYTSGWGDSWQHTVNGAKFLWEGFTEFAKASFNLLVQGIMIGIDKIKLGWYEFKEAMGMGDSAENLKMINQINADVETRKKSISDGFDKSDNAYQNAKKEFGQISIKVDTEGIKKDFNKIQQSFSGAGAKKDPMELKVPKNRPAGNASSKSTPDTIVSGGSKSTSIVINISKLQDDTKIYVDSAERGISELGLKVQEILLRSVNSINQMQTE